MGMNFLNGIKYGQKNTHVIKAFIYWAHAGPTKQMRLTHGLYLRYYTTGFF